MTFHNDNNEKNNFKDNVRESTSKHKQKKLVDLKDLDIEEQQKYQKYQRLDEKEKFRQRFRDLLGEEGFKEFSRIAELIKEDGIVTFRDFIESDQFTQFQQAYDKKMQEAASKSKIQHYFLNFKGHNDFLLNPEFKDAFFHPLLIAIIAYEMGGPIRIVDIRGKDAEPAYTVERDNGPHVDDSLYFRELKILITWKQGENSGPQGQNFVALPRSHNLVRSRPSEFGANFKSSSELANEVCSNPNLVGKTYVMEAKDKRPLTTIFEASSEVHHRYRTKNGAARSCVIFAFHLDDKGYSPPAYDSTASKLNPNPLDGFLFTSKKNQGSVDDEFLEILKESKDLIIDKSKKLIEKKRLIPAKEKMLNKEDTIKYFEVLNKTEILEDSRKPHFSSNEIANINHQDFIFKLLEIGEHDKHHDLDLIIDPERKEQIRKIPRTRIRERALEATYNRESTRTRFTNIKKLSNKEDCFPLNIDSLIKISDQFSERITELLKHSALLGSELTVELEAILRLGNDLGEAYNHCEDMKVFRANSYFMYLLLDETFDIISKRLTGQASKDPLFTNSTLVQFIKDTNKMIDSSAQVLLQHYADTVVLNDLTNELKFNSKINLEKEALSTDTLQKLSGLLVKDNNHDNGECLFCESKSKNNSLTSSNNLFKSKKITSATNLSEASKQLHDLSKKNFSLAETRAKDSNIFPVSKNQFLEMLKVYYAENKTKKTLDDCAKELLQRLKSESTVGDYGRFSTLIEEAKIIKSDRTVIYFPLNKKPSNLPEDKYYNPTTSKANPMVTTISGSQQLWEKKIKDTDLSKEASEFYKQNKFKLDNILQDKKFISKFDSFYPSNCMIDGKLQLSNAKTQELVIFESISSQIKGGQIIISVPTGMPQGTTELIKEAALIENALLYKQETGKYPAFIKEASPSVQKFLLGLSNQEIDNIMYDINAIDQPLSPIKGKKIFLLMERYQGTVTNEEIRASKYDLIPGKKRSKNTKSNFATSFASHIPVETKAQLPMTERGDLVFLLGVEFNESYAVFQNSRDSASVPEHYHCYALKKEEILGAQTTIPLFKAAVEKEIFREKINGLPIKLEKMDWSATCYRLSVPLNSKDKESFLKISAAIKEIQDKMLSGRDDLSFTFICTQNNGQLEFYMGPRKCIYQNPMPNLLANKADLQPPFNGGLEFAGINTMKDEAEFNKYQEAWITNPAEAEKLFQDIQAESHQKIKPSTLDIETFEKLATKTLQHACTSAKEVSLNRMANQ